MFVISGWGIAPESVAPLFPAGTRVLAPTRENIASLAGAQRVVGYSLGAFLLLEAAARGEFSCADVSLFAPFLAFPREAGAGGKISATQVKFLRRWAGKNPAAALAENFPVRTFRSSRRFSRSRARRARAGKLPQRR